MELANGGKIIKTQQGIVFASLRGQLAVWSASRKEDNILHCFHGSYFNIEEFEKAVTFYRLKVAEREYILANRAESAAKDAAKAAKAVFETAMANMDAIN